MAIIGGLALVFSGIGVAIFLINEAELCLSRTRALIELLSTACDLVKNYSMSAPEILARCDAELMLACGYPSDAPVPKSFEEMSALCEIPDAESRAAFAAFSRDFGKSYREQEIQRCGACIERLAKRERSLGAALPSKKKIIFSVSVCAALALLILFL